MNLTSLKITGVDLFMTGDEVSMSALLCTLNDSPLMIHLNRPFKAEMYRLEGQDWRVTAMWDDPICDLSKEDLVKGLMINREIITGTIKGLKTFIPKLNIEYTGSEFYVQMPNGTVH